MSSSRSASTSTCTSSSSSPPLYDVTSPPIVKSQQTPYQSLNVVTYNILSPKYLATYKDDPAYRELTDSMWDWERRRALILSRLIASKADIIFLQECEIPQVEQDWGSLRQHGYDWAIQDLKNSAKHHSTGVVTLFKRSSFPRGVAFNDPRSRTLITALHVGEEEKEKDETHVDTNGTINSSEQPNSSTIVSNQTQTSSDSQTQTQTSNTPPQTSTMPKMLYLVNVHLEGHPSQSDIRFSQMRSSLESITRHVIKQGTNLDQQAIIVAGDFNENHEYGTVHTLLTERTLPANYHCSHTNKTVTKTAYTHPFLFVDTYQHSRPIMTYCQSRWGGVIDYIYLTSPCLSLHSLMRVVPRTYDTHLVMPNEYQPSDHFMCGCVMLMLPNMTPLIVDEEEEELIKSKKQAKREARMQASRERSRSRSHSRTPSPNGQESPTSTNSMSNDVTHIEYMHALKLDDNDAYFVRQPPTTTNSQDYATT